MHEWSIISLKNNTQKLVFSALFLAIGMILPFFTMQIPAIGNMLLPMHIPVLLCGFICGGPYGALVGLILPLLRSATFGAPVMMPTAFSMAVELMVYGLCSGLFYHAFQKIRGAIILSLILTMIAGRVAWGLVSLALYRGMGAEFGWEIFATQAFLNAIPGIILQIIFIPAVLTAISKKVREV